MPRYSVKCDCSRDIPVELFQAGMQVECAECHRKVAVPSITTLKMESGDKYPLLSAWEKIERYKQQRLSPFDGNCQKCRTAPAVHARNVTFNSMQERGDAGKLHVPGVMTVQYFEETWRRASFPFLLCDECNRRFKADWRNLQLKKIAWLLVEFVVVASLTYFTLEGIRTAEEVRRADEFRTQHITLAVNISFAVTFLTWVAIEIGFRQKSRISKADPTTFRWLSEIPVIEDLFRGEDEFKLGIGVAHAYTMPAADGKSA